jgi:outer membrane receptor for ferrienterochelin and colicin
MLPAATVLDVVRTTGRAVQSHGRFEEAYRRAARGNGVFFTRADIEASNAYDLKSLLIKVPTVNANDRGVSFQRCQNSGALRPEERNKVQVWVDGRRVTARSSTMRGTLEVQKDLDTYGDNTTDILATIPPSSVEIIEVYPSQSVIPAEFLADACAVIAIWTRSH